MSVKLARLSFVSALLVVAIHCTYRIDAFDSLPRAFAWTQMAVNCGITRIAVPLFFVMFGFLLFKDFDGTRTWWLAKLRSRFRSLVLPYFVWALIGLAVLLACNAIRAHPEPMDLRSLPWWGRALGITSPPLGLYVLWFVREAIFALALAPLIGLGVRFAGLWGIGLLAILGALISNHCWHLACISFGAYLALGGVATMSRLSAWLRKGVCTAGVGALWGLLIAVVVGQNVYGTGGGRMVDRAMNVVGMVFVWTAYEHVKGAAFWRVFDPVLKSSFVIYVLHSLVGMFVQYPMLHGGFAARYPFAFCLASYLLMVGLPTLAWVAIHKCLPRWGVVLLTGGR